MRIEAHSRGEHQETSAVIFCDQKEKNRMLSGKCKDLKVNSKNARLFFGINQTQELRHVETTKEKKEKSLLNWQVISEGKRRKKSDKNTHFSFPMRETIPQAALQENPRPFDSLLSISKFNGKGFYISRQSDFQRRLSAWLLMLEMTLHAHAWIPSGMCLLLIREEGARKNDRFQHSLSVCRVHFFVPVPTLSWCMAQSQAACAMKT